MRPGIKFYTKLEETSLEPKKYNKELKEAGLSGKDILFTERKEHSGNYIVFFENNGIYEYHPYDNINGLASGQKARTLEGCISRAHCMGLFENDTGVAKQMKAADGLLDVKVNFKESLFRNIKNVSKLNESCSNSEECDETILDKSFFWLKTHGYWCIDFETENGYCFNLYSNDMDPSKWFGQLNKKNGSDGNNHSIYDIHSRSCYSELGSYDRPDNVTTPREIFERTPYSKEKIVSVKANKPDIDLGKAVEYGVTISIKKKLCRLSYKAAADRLYRREIEKVLEHYGKKEDYRTKYPEVGDDWELVDKLIAEAVANIKAEKKAAAAAKRAVREGIGEAFHSEGFNESNKTSRNRLREKMYTDELSDQLENDILSAANENADGPHVVLTDVLDTLEYEFGYNYKGELYPNLSVIVKYLEQAGYIVEE